MISSEGNLARPGKNSHISCPSLCTQIIKEITFSIKKGRLHLQPKKIHSQGRFKTRMDSFCCVLDGETIAMGKGAYAAWHKRRSRRHLLAGLSAQLNDFANLQAEEPHSNISYNTNRFPPGCLPRRAARRIPLPEQDAGK